MLCTGSCKSRSDLSEFRLTTNVRQRRISSTLGFSLEVALLLEILGNCCHLFSSFDVVVLRLLLESTVSPLSSTTEKTVDMHITP